MPSQAKPRKASQPHKKQPVPPATPTHGLSRVAGEWVCDGWALSRGDSLILCGPGGARIPATITETGEVLRVMLTLEGATRAPATLREGAPVRLPEGVYRRWLAEGLVDADFAPTWGGPIGVV